MRFQNRSSAGRLLGVEVAALAFESPVVVAMPRGGVPVAIEMAQMIDAPMDIVVARKIGAPSQPEFAIGAVAEGGVVLVNRRDAVRAGVGESDFAVLVERAEAELAGRVARYRPYRRPLKIDGRTTILVDDGLATGLTAAASARCLRTRGAGRIVLAVPVCAETCLYSSPDPSIDRLVCLIAPRKLHGVGYWYDDFSQVSNDEVLALLSDSQSNLSSDAPSDVRPLAGPD